MCVKQMHNMYIYVPVHLGTLKVNSAPHSDQGATLPATLRGLSLVLVGLQYLEHVGFLIRYDMYMYKYKLATDRIWYLANLFGCCFRVGSYRLCSDDNPTALSILLFDTIWSCRHSQFCPILKCKY